MNDHRQVSHLYTLALMYRVLHLTRAGFYDWLNKPLSDWVIQSQCLDLIAASATYGRLREVRLVRANKIRAIRIGKAPRHAAKRPSIIPQNRLTGEFIMETSNLSWCSYIPWRGWLSLAFVVDL